MNHDNDDIRPPQPVFDNNSGKPSNPLKRTVGISDDHLNIGRDNFFEDAIKRYIEKENNQWVGVDPDNPNNLTFPLDSIPDDDIRARDFIERAVDGIIHSYREWWEENKGFKGIYVDPENLLEHFRLDRFDSNDYSRTVTFSLTPDPIFHDDKFDAYGLRLSKSGDYITARIRLYGHYMIPSRDEDDSGMVLPSLMEMGSVGWSNGDRYWLFETIRDHDELFWHNVVLQSLIVHDTIENTTPKPVEAFLKIARPNQLPSEEEFVKTLDKIKLVEGLE